MELNKKAASDEKCSLQHAAEASTWGEAGISRGMVRLD